MDQSGRHRLTPKRAKTKTSRVRFPCGRPCSGADPRSIRRSAHIALRPSRRAPGRFLPVSRDRRRLHIPFRPPRRDVPCHRRRGRFPLPARPGLDRYCRVRASRCPCISRRAHRRVWLRRPRTLRPARLRPARLRPVQLCLVRLCLARLCLVQLRDRRVRLHRRLVRGCRSVRRRGQPLIRALCLANRAHPLRPAAVLLADSRASVPLPGNRPPVPSFLLAPIWLRNWGSNRVHRCPGRRRRRVPAFRCGRSRRVPVSRFTRVRHVPAQRPWRAAVSACVHRCPGSAPVVRGRCTPLRAGG